MTFVTNYGKLSGLKLKYSYGKSVMENKIYC